MRFQTMIYRTLIALLVLTSCQSIAAPTTRQDVLAWLNTYASATTQDEAIGAIRAA